MIVMQHPDSKREEFLSIIRTMQGKSSRIPRVSKIKNNYKEKNLLQVLYNVSVVNYCLNGCRCAYFILVHVSDFMAVQMNIQRLIIIL